MAIDLQLTVNRSSKFKVHLSDSPNIGIQNTTAKTEFQTFAEQKRSTCKSYVIYPQMPKNFGVL